MLVENANAQSGKKENPYREHSQGSHPGAGVSLPASHMPLQRPAVVQLEYRATHEVLDVPQPGMERQASQAQATTENSY